ncbi:GtrA family protein [Siccirubricoccus sp. KC 17139]|uniref:GtrA family protein n=1 Tax=Siccirubricoccus soli TaxID=2899147 RepID=A0ABT1DAD3_9PROT|nr:GtrA family protein [Siccirubricoccus soli]MCO6418902.1 GtrA family protein [Siccirubricoccus soli]MCP2685037.1 GtrA family protein [Siccirubricoccus soli]
MIALFRTPSSLADHKLVRLAGEFFRFGVVGVAGFIVDAAVLMAGIALGLGPWLGRALSYLLGATTTFALNRAWTWRHAPRDAVGRRWALFLLVNLVGFACNYGTYAFMLTHLPLAAAHPVIGVAAGSLAGMVGNFLLSRRFVFARGGEARPLPT